ncbi:hypothetical protein J437_LFUL008501, partial [Ladona fulva]
MLLAKERRDSERKYPARNRFAVWSELSLRTSPFFMDVYSCNALLPFNAKFSLSALGCCSQWIWSLSDSESGGFNVIPLVSKMIFKPNKVCHEMQPGYVKTLEWKCKTLLLFMNIPTAKVAEVGGFLGLLHDINLHINDYSYTFMIYPAKKHF